MSADPRRNVFWSGLEAGVSGLLSFVSACVVARLVGPSELGLGAAAVAVNVLLWVAVNGLFADALVQRGSLDVETLSGAFWASAAAGVFASLLQAGTGWGLAIWLDDTRLLPMSLLLALALPLVGAAGAMQGVLTLRRAYRALALRSIVGQGLGTLAGIAAARAHAGAWAPVAQQFVACTAGAMVLLRGAESHMFAAPRWPPLRRLLRVGLPLTAGTLVLAARYRIFAVLIGGIAGSAVLGQVHMAFRLVDTVRELSFTAQWRLMLPLLSERQHDAAALRAACDRLAALSSRAMLPACGAMALVLPAAVQALLGPGWAASARAGEPLIGLMALLTLMFPAGVAVIARGDATRPLLGGIAAMALTLAGTVALRPATPLGAVLLWAGAQLAVVPYLLRIGGRALGGGPLRPLRPGLPAAAATLAAVAAVGLLLRLTGEPASPACSVLMRIGLLGAMLWPLGRGVWQSARGPGPGAAHAGEAKDRAAGQTAM